MVNPCVAVLISYNLGRIVLSSEAPLRGYASATESSASLPSGKHLKFNSVVAEQARV